MTTITVAGRVLFDFTAEAYPEVSVSEGEKVDVHYAPKGSPWIYVHTKNNRKGYIPVDYFEEEGMDQGLSEEEMDVSPPRINDPTTTSNQSQNIIESTAFPPPNGLHCFWMDSSIFFR